jgi:hypothetical protein
VVALKNSGSNKRARRHQLLLAKPEPDYHVQIARTSL